MHTTLRLIQEYPHNHLHILLHFWALKVDIKLAHKQQQQRSINKSTFHFGPVINKYLWCIIRSSWTVSCDESITCAQISHTSTSVLLPIKSWGIQFYVTNKFGMALSLHLCTWKRASMSYKLGPS